MEDIQKVKISPIPSPQWFINIFVNMLYRVVTVVMVSLSSFLTQAQSELECLVKSEMMRSFSGKLNKKSLLTESYNIQYQRLELNIDLHQKWVQGKVTSCFTPLKPAFNLIQFDLEDYLKVDSVLFHGKPVPYTHLNKALTIELSKNVAENTLDSVSVFYSGNPGLNNPYQSFIFDAHDRQDPKPIAWTLSQPYGAKGWWPCKESLYDKIDSLDVWVTVHKGNKVASNGILLFSKDVNDSMVCFYWKHRYPIATYLVAVAVTNYIEYEDFVVYPYGDSLSILNYVYPEYESEARTKSKETVKMMHLFDSLFGKYPFLKEKYGHAQWGWGGGMEHQTISFMVHLNYDLTAHELAHQWFGDYATCGSWQDLWLNEGFATYLNGLCHQYLNTGTSFRNYMTSMRGDITKKDDGSIFVTDTMDRSFLFDGRLRYQKAAYFIHMLRWKVGNENFYNGLRNYLSSPKVRYGFGRTSDLKTALESASGLNLTEFFKDWYFGEGHPVYNITWSHVGNQLEIRILQEQSHPSVSFFNIPIQIKIHGKYSDSTVILDPLSRDNTFKFTLNFIPEDIEFDPNFWILSQWNVIKVKPDNSPDIHVFPVPAEEALSLINYRGNILEAKITDPAGRKIIEINYQLINDVREKQELEISNLTSGVYFLEVKTDLGFARKKFLKK